MTLKDKVIQTDFMGDFNYEDVKQSVLELKKEILNLECNRCRTKMLKAYYDLIGDFEK